MSDRHRSKNQSDNCRLPSRPPRCHSDILACMFEASLHGTKAWDWQHRAYRALLIKWSRSLTSGERALLSRNGWMQMCNLDEASRRARRDGGTGYPVCRWLLWCVLLWVLLCVLLSSSQLPGQIERGASKNSDDDGNDDDGILSLPLILTQNVSLDVDTRKRSLVYFSSLGWSAEQRRGERRMKYKWLYIFNLILYSLIWYSHQNYDAQGLDLWSLITFHLSERSGGERLTINHFLEHFHPTSSQEQISPR